MNVILFAICELHYIAGARVFEACRQWDSVCCVVDQLQPGTVWTLHNAKVDMYRGCMRLAVDQFGKLEQSDGTSIEPKVKVKAWGCLLPCQQTLWCSCSATCFAFHGDARASCNK